MAVDIGKGAKYTAAAIATRRTSQKMTSGDSEVTQLHKVPVFGKAQGGRSQCRCEKAYFRTTGTSFQRFYDSGTRGVRALAQSDGKRLVGRAAPAGRGLLPREDRLRNVSSLSSVFLPSVVDYLKKCELADESETVIIPNFCISLCFPL